MAANELWDIVPARDCQCVQQRQVGHQYIKKIVLNIKKQSSSAVCWPSCKWNRNVTDVSVGSEDGVCASSFKLPGLASTPPPHPPTPNSAHCQDSQQRLGPAAIRTGWMEVDSRMVKGHEQTGSYLPSYLSPSQTALWHHKTGRGISQRDEPRKYGKTTKRW